MARNAGDQQPKGYQQLTVSNTAVALTVPTGALTAMIQNETGGNIRMRDDGTDPTAAIGFLIPSGSTLEYDGTLSRVKLIRVAGDVTTNILYYG